jgi:hypothetical protein
MVNRRVFREIKSAVALTFVLIVYNLMARGIQRGNGFDDVGGAKVWFAREYRYVANAKSGFKVLGLSTNESFVAADVNLMSEGTPSLACVTVGSLIFPFPGKDDDGIWRTGRTSQLGETH